MVRRITLYLAITLGIFAELLIIQNGMTFSHIQNNLQHSTPAVVVASIEPIITPEYVPLPKGEFSAPHAKIGRAGRDLWVLEEEFVYVDSRGKVWTAPAGTITDGASIPQAFLSATGDRLDGAYLDAAVIHDAYCGIDNAELATYQQETWQYVHYVFYEALLTNGMSEQQAKIMYTAVYLGGPRWGEGAEDSEDQVLMTGFPTSSQNNMVVADPASTPEELVAEFEDYLAWIESENPTVEEINARLANG
ncbi:MAG: DUF1353 domain-containing protein [Anaerolineae bacterium]